MFSLSPPSPQRLHWQLPCGVHHFLQEGSTECDLYASLQSGRLGHYSGHCIPPGQTNGLCGRFLASWRIRL